MELLIIFSLILSFALALGSEIMLLVTIHEENKATYQKLTKNLFLPSILISFHCWKEIHKNSPRQKRLLTFCLSLYFVFLSLILVFFCFYLAR